MPLEENPYTVPHLKALNSGQNLWGGQRCGRTLGNQYFASYIAIAAVYFECICILNLLEGES